MGLTTLKPRISPQRDRFAHAKPSLGMYGYRWQQARAEHLAGSPFCVMCKQQNVVRAATVVDHITPHRGDLKLFWDANNWQSLCANHHSSDKQRAENGNG